MLRKLITIRNVGRFLNYSAGGDVELKRYSLIFAENGRGKTTLCAILRSLQSGEPALVKGRTTLGAAGSADIKILQGNGSTAAFSNGAWSATVPNLAVFDSTFISENVYSGDAVDLGQKRNLYGVIVGKAGADMARQIEELDAASRDKNPEIREKRAAVQALALGLTPEAFLTLPADPAIDEQIVLQERELAAVTQADQIKTRAALSLLTLPDPPAGIVPLLGRTLEGIAENAERRVTVQIEAHAMHGRGQNWLSEGLSYLRGDACPFCGQGLEGVALIAAYRAYFSEAYNALRAEIVDLRSRVETSLNDRTIAGIERIVDQNVAATEFWTAYCPFAAPVLAGDRTGDALRAFRDAALALLDRKSASPLEAVVPDVAFTEAQTALAVVQGAITAYNTAVAEANSEIHAKKTATSAANIQAVQAALTRLRATKARHEGAGAAACIDYETTVARKETIERDKNALKKKLDDYAETVMAQYEKTINGLLTEFQAGFRITGTTQSYSGGPVSSTYKILINDTEVDLGDPATALDKPSFRNTLSSGDRSTLALAFFLAQLEHDPDKASRIVVFDDPFNSQDGFRKDCTIRKIKRCGTDCIQVIVLSHDLDFLKRIWDRLEPADRKCLKLERVGQRDTKAVPLDIEQATQAHFKANVNVLLDYYLDNKGDARDVVQKIRPVLEAHCKLLGGTLLADNDTLGVMVGKIRDAGPGHQLYPLCDDLEDLNEYTRNYHHGENPHAATEPISDLELQGKVRRALELTGWC